MRFKNGDRVTGKIVSTVGNSIRIKTALFGEVTFSRNDITAIESDETLYVTMNSGRILAGELKQESEATLMVSPDMPPERLDFKEVRAIRDEYEQARSVNPSWSRFWSHKIDVGMAASAGNAQNTTIHTGTRTVRDAANNKIQLNFDQLYSAQSTTLPFGTTANRVHGGVRLDRSFTRRGYAFTTADFDFDQFQDLDLRSVVGGGLGRKLVNNNRSQITVDGGMVWNHEIFSNNLTRNAAEFIIGEQVKQVINPLLTVYHDFRIYPRIEPDAGDYRFDSTAGIAMKLSRRLSWDVKAIDRYLSNPVDQNKRNDLTVTVGIGFLLDDGQR